MLGPLIGTLLLSYFAFFALFGERSIGRLMKVQQEIATTQKEVEAIKAEYTELNQRVEHLRPQSLDLDLAEEQARRDLNLVHPDEEVVLIKPDKNAER